MPLLGTRAQRLEQEKTTTGPLATGLQPVTACCRGGTGSYGVVTATYGVVTGPYEKAAKSKKQFKHLYSLLRLKQQASMRADTSRYRIGLFDTNRFER